MLFYRNVLGSLAVSQCWSWGEITGAGIYFLAWLVVAALCAGGIRDVISAAICLSLSPPSNLPNRTISSSLYLRVCVYVTHNSSSIQWWCGHTRWQCCYLDVSWRHSQKRCFQHGYKDVLLDELVSCFSAVIVDLEEELLAGEWLRLLWVSTEISGEKLFLKGSKYENKHFSVVEDDVDTVAAVASTRLFLHYWPSQWFKLLNAEQRSVLYMVTPQGSDFTFLPF